MLEYLEDYIEKGSNYLKMGYGLIEIKHESTTMYISNKADSRLRKVGSSLEHRQSFGSVQT